MNTMMKNNGQWMCEMGKRLKECRIQIGKSTDEMATELGISDSEYKGIEEGKVKINLEMAIILDERFNVNCRYLLTGKEVQYSAYLAELLKTCSQEKKETVNIMLLHMINLLKTSNDREHTSEANLDALMKNIR